MKKLPLLLILLASVIFYSCSKNSPEELIIGKWETVQHTTEGIKHVLEFSDDGKVFMKNLLKMDYDYKLINDSILIISHSDSNLIYAFADTITININDNGFIQKKMMHGHMEDIVWNKIDEGSGNKLAGKYERIIESDIKGTMEFTGDGIAKYRIPSRHREGVFEINEEGLSMVFHGTGYHKQQFSVSEDSLIIQGVKPGQETIYLRVNE